MALDIHQEITNRIITILEAGQAGTWTCPWHRTGGGLPTNALTGRRYRGINILSLWAAEQVSGYVDSRWATYRQWSELGAQVRKSERSTLVVFYKDYCGTGEDGGDERRFVARASSAFNAEQVENAPGSQDGALPVGADPTPAFDAFVAATGATIEIGGEAACYVPALDLIRMPPRERFHTTHGYAATLAHELVHWTGAKTRLDRDLTTRFRSDAYAAEELVAELGAAFTLASLGLASEPHSRHAAYIASWTALLRNDHRAIFTAATKASQAVDHLFAPAR